MGDKKGIQKKKFNNFLSIVFTMSYTSLELLQANHAMLCIMADVLPTKVDAQCDKTCDN